VPDEEGGNLATAQRRGQHLRVQILDRDLRRIDAVLGQIFGNEPRARGADPGRDRLAHELLRLRDVLACDGDVAFGVPLDDGDGAVIALHAKEILRAGKTPAYNVCPGRVWNDGTGVVREENSR